MIIENSARYWGKSVKIVDSWNLYIMNVQNESSVNSMQIRKVIFATIFFSNLKEFVKTIHYT